MSFTFGPNRDSGSVRRNRNPDTKRRPSDWAHERREATPRVKVVRELPDPVDEPYEEPEFILIDGCSCGDPFCEYA